jgi:hypothetical protein
MKNTIFSISFYFSTCLSSIFSKSFQYSTDFFPYFLYLFTIQLIFLPYFPNLITIQLSFLPYFIWKIRKKIVKRYGKYRRKLWNDVKNMEEKLVEMWNVIHNSTYFSSIISISFHYFLPYFPYLFTIFCHIFNNISHFN